MINLEGFVTGILHQDTAGLADLQVQGEEYCSYKTATRINDFFHRQGTKYGGNNLNIASGHCLSKQIYRYREKNTAPKKLLPELMIFSPTGYQTWRK